MFCARMPNPFQRVISSRPWKWRYIMTTNAGKGPFTITSYYLVFLCVSTKQELGRLYRRVQWCFDLHRSRSFRTSNNVYLHLTTLYNCCTSVASSDNPKKGRRIHNQNLDTESWCFWINKWSLSVTGRGFPGMEFHNFSIGHAYVTQ